MAVSGLARKFWTMTSCTWPYMTVGVSDGQQRFDAFLSGLADANEDAGSEGNLELACEVEGLHAH